MTEDVALLLMNGLLALGFVLAAFCPTYMTRRLVGAQLKARGIPLDHPKVVGVMQFVGTVGAWVSIGLLIFLGRAWWLGS